ncbi:hypothetical protein OG788_37010 [Streptomyces sp. NBC_00647]|uniref:hypothetical protein n=1 Tax=Streptomyces sp. NBC_00647 TaxID=2975796 RepID=UPI003254D25A
MVLKGKFVGEFIGIAISILMHGVHPLLIALDATMWTVKGWNWIQFLPAKREMRRVRKTREINNGAAGATNELAADIPASKREVGTAKVGITYVSDEKFEKLCVEFTPSRGGGKESVCEVVVRVDD